MNAAYVDTSCLVAIAFDEPGGKDLARTFAGLGMIFSSNLMEAELRSAAAREGVDGIGGLLTWLTWILPDRPLSRELSRVLEAGYARGADLWHLANALYLVEDPRDLPFFTLDQRQAEVARSLGFPLGL